MSFGVNPSRAFLILILFSSAGFAQKQAWEIAAYKNQANIGAVLDTVVTDTLYVTAFNNRLGIEIDSIRYLKEIEEYQHHAVSGMLIGMMGGGLVGNRLGKNSGKGEGIFDDAGDTLGIIVGTGLGIIAGGLVGGFAGARMDQPKVINFEGKSKQGKIAILRKLSVDK